MRSGDYLAAFDLAERAAGEFSGDLQFEYVATLALARSNATEQAARRYNRALRDHVLAPLNDLAIDILSLGARIAKDQAFRASRARSGDALRDASRAYGAVFEQTRAAFPAINAATLAMLADELGAAHAFAHLAINAAEREMPESPIAQYYRMATLAEAHLVLGSVVEAEAALGRAVEFAPKEFAAHTTTLRQLRRLARHLGLATGFLACLKAPSSIHYAGHRFSANFPAHEESRVADEIANVFAERSVGFAFGSLAAGADILFAEAALQRGCGLHVVLPFRRDDFIRLCVGPSGAQWVDRFSRCIEHADHVSYATMEGSLGDDAPYGYASRLAMGLATLQASHLLSEVHQIVVWDGVSSAENAAAGTWVDMNAWREAGRQTEVIHVAAGQRQSAEPRQDVGGRRTARALLFGDMRGFSKLRDAQLMTFTREVLGACARVLDRFDGIGLRNTWGDGLFVVMEDAPSAAACALDLQEAIAAIDLASAGLPTDISLRLAAHFGPVFSCIDPITRTQNYFGEHVSRTARVEPVTPEGSVYVTESFAAEIALRSGLDFRCEYVGQIDSAKGYGKFRMYALMRGR